VDPDCEKGAYDDWLNIIFGTAAATLVTLSTEQTLLGLLIVINQLCSSQVFAVLQFISYTFTPPFASCTSAFRSKP
jgi:hypothetical protein